MKNPYPFPEETLEYSRKYTQTLSDHDPLEILQTIVAFTKGSYDFSGSLRSGMYSYFPHEIDNTHITGFNCTTVIPHLYTVAQELGFKPQIVQFAGIKDTHAHDHEESMPSDSPHFALIVDVNRSRPYLIDTFFRNFGPIMERTDGSIHIGPTKYFGGSTRSYDHLTYVDAHEFAAMIEEGKDPVKSLDVLVSGQSFGFVENAWGEKVVHQNVTYKPDVSVSTRIMQSHPFLMSNCAIGSYTEDEMIFGTILDQPTAPIVHMYKVRDVSWNDHDGVLVAVDDLRNLGALWRSFGELDTIPKSKIVDPTKNPRVGRKLIRARDKELKTALLDYMDGASRTITREQRVPITLMRVPEDLARLVGLRTLYSYHNVDRALAFEAEEHKHYLAEQMKLLSRVEAEITEDANRLFLHNNRIERLPGKEASRLRKLTVEHDRRWDRLKKATNYLRKMYVDHRKNFHVLADQLLFAHRYGGMSMDDIVGTIFDKGYDSRVGYATLVHELTDFVVMNEQNITMREFREPIRSKLAAKRDMPYIPDRKVILETAGHMLDPVLEAMLKLNPEEKSELFRDFDAVISAITEGRTRTLATQGGLIEVPDVDLKRQLSNILIAATEKLDEREN